MRLSEALAASGTEPQAAHWRDSGTGLVREVRAADGGWRLFTGSVSTSGRYDPEYDESDYPSLAAMDVDIAYGVMGNDLWVPGPLAPRHDSSVRQYYPAHGDSFYPCPGCGDPMDTPNTSCMGCAYGSDKGFWTQGYH